MTAKTKKEVHFKSRSYAIKNAFKNRDKILFEKLMTKQHNVKEIDEHDFYPDDGDLTMWDLFHRLDPYLYKNKSYKNLTAYEKLYVKLFEKYLALELGHRLNLGGMVDLKYDNKDLGKVSLEGQLSGFGLIQLKDHLLHFLTNDRKNSPGFYQALDKILAIKPQAKLCQNNKHINSQGNIFLFGHVNHNWCAFLAENKLYLINMGIGADDSPGIHIYDVPKSKKTKVFNYLKKLENIDLLENITQGLEQQAKNKHGEVDFDKYQKLIIERYQKLLEFKHFKAIPKKFNLKELESITIPAQEVGNCNYYSLKGLVLALMYHFNQRIYPKTDAFKKSLADFLAFIKFDYDVALEHYVGHSLRPNKNLIYLAKNKMKKNRNKPIDCVLTVGDKRRRKTIL